MLEIRKLLVLGVFMFEVFFFPHKIISMTRKSLPLRMKIYVNSHTVKATKVLRFRVLVWPGKEPTHSWEQLPTDSVMNKSCSYWFFPELTQGTANFSVFGLQNKNSLCRGLCFFTEVSLYIEVPQKNFFKALHREGLHTKCLVLLMWTIQISIISSVRKAEEICMLLWERQKKPAYFFSSANYASTNTIPPGATK